MTVPKNVLTATDFSQNSSSAVQYACDLARDSGSKLHLLHVSKDELDSTEHEQRLERLGIAVDPRSELALETVKHVLIGNPARAIADYANRNAIDLIIVGTHGRTGLLHLAMGSVTEALLRQAPCPVTVLGPHDGKNATLNHAVQTLEKMIGDGWEMDKDMGRSLMSKRLVDELRVTSTTAIIMVDELEYRDWLRWDDGKWLIVPGNELLEEFQPIFLEHSPENQAIELVKRAQKLRATDIHIDPISDIENLVRIRIDGQLKTYCRLDRRVAEHLMNQFKTLARLGVSDPFHPQEGHVQLPSNFQNVEVRLSSVPVAEGCAMALRILDPAKIFLPLENLGFSEKTYPQINQMLQSRGGLVLITGPTGSGKTTTVYSMLETIGGETNNIVSIEDPVEFNAPFVRQISVDKSHGLTFAKGLKTLLRMDPDVLFVGEIRDSETAHIAMRAASSGKYVFSTLHTRDVATTISSLVELGIKQQSIAANLIGIVNQRLLRRLCENCREEVQPDDRIKCEFESAGLQAPPELFESRGCSVCNDSGYLGRIGIFEVAIIENSQRMGLENCNLQDELTTALVHHDVKSLHQDALVKAADGLIAYQDAQSITWFI